MATAVVKVYCNKCLDERRHEVLFREVQSWEEEYDEFYSISGANTYELIKCLGCENVALRHESWFSENTDERGRPEVVTTLYPPETYRREPTWLIQSFGLAANGRDFIIALLKEIYAALRNDSQRLAVMGIRALLEQVMVDKVRDQGSFKANLDAFEEKGFVSSLQRKILEPVIEAGHATMHRAFKPTKADVMHLMDITEHIIEAIYINEARVSDVARRVPKRKKKFAKKKTAVQSKTSSGQSGRIVKK